MDDSKNKRDIAYKAMVNDSVVYVCMDYVTVQHEFQRNNGCVRIEEDEESDGESNSNNLFVGTVGCVLMAGKILSMSASTINFLPYTRNYDMKIIDSPSSEMLKADIERVFSTRNDAFVKASEILQL